MSQRIRTTVTLLKIIQKVSVWITIATLLVSILSGIGTAIVVYFVFQSPQLAMYQNQLDIMNKTLSTQNESLSIQHEQIGIMNESLLKRVQLALEVVPRYEWKLSFSSNGSMQFTNTTLTLPRNEPTIFHIYVSNLGNAIGHLLYWTVHIFSPPNTTIRSGPISDIQNIILAPYGLYNMTYTFDPSTVSTSINEVVFTFALMSTESTVYETVNAIFR